MSSVPSGSVERDASKAISRSGPTSAMGDVESGSSDEYSGVPGVPARDVGQIQDRDRGLVLLGWWSEDRQRQRQPAGSRAVVAVATVVVVHRDRVSRADEVGRVFMGVVERSPIRRLRRATDIGVVDPDAEVRSGRRVEAVVDRALVGPAVRVLGVAEAGSTDPELAGGQQRVVRVSVERRVRYDRRAVDRDRDRLEQLAGGRRSPAATARLRFRRR